MRRSIAVLFWILLGALAAGGTTGYFLHRANVDRRQLSEQTDQLRQELDAIKQQNEALTIEANTKITNASTHVDTAQQTVAALQEENRLLKLAQHLEEPTVYQLKSWDENICIPLGVTLKLPPGSRVISNGTVLSVGTDVVRGTFPDAWLSITPYDQTRETTLLSGLQNAEPVTYFVGGRIATGQRGIIDAEGHIGFVMKAQTDANVTHLIWARGIGNVTEKQILETLATVTFRS